MPLAAFRASIVLRFLAALFVCVIVADVAAQGHCDELLTPSGSALALSAGTASTTDACAQVCVPDCYCCAGGVEHAAEVVVGGVGPVTRAVAVAPPPSPDGVRPLPYRPPLAVA